MSARFMVCAGILIVCLFLGGCGGGGGDSSGWTDHFLYMTSGRWDVNAQVQTVDGHLRLSSSPGKGADIQSVLSDLCYGSLEFKAHIANWAVDTSIGYETWEGGHRAILLTGGDLTGGDKDGQPLGHFVVINPALREAHIPIPEFDAKKDNINKFRIVWTADSASLYVNDELSVTYQWDNSPDLPPVPDVPLCIRLNASNDHYDEVQVDWLTARNAGGGIVLDEDFSQLCPTVWTIVKGSSATNCGSWLKLVSKGPGQGAQVQTREAFRYGFLEAKAESNNWSPDTKIGYEVWATEGYYGIVITEGKLRVTSPACSPPDIPIDGWDAIKGQANVFKIVWQEDSVLVYINDGLQPAATYQGPCVPVVPMKVRLNASNDLADELSVDYVTVRY